jgi:hypothetical protein
MAGIERFEDLTRWQKARELNHLVYDKTRKGALNLELWILNGSE